MSSPRTYDGSHSPADRCATGRWRPGDEVEFRVSDRHLRHYTPSRFDPVTGTFDVIFCTLANGPGSSWAADLRRGQQVRVIGPQSKPPTTHHGRRSVLLGDASTLGLFTSLSEAGANPEARGAIEVPQNDRQAAAQLVPRLDILDGPRSTRRCPAHMDRRPDVRHHRPQSRKLSTSPDTHRPCKGYARRCAPPVYRATRSSQKRTGQLATADCRHPPLRTDSGACSTNRPWSESSSQPLARHHPDPDPQWSSTNR